MGSVSRGIVLANWEAGDEPGRLVEAAVAAEESGWDGVFLADHLIFPPPQTIGGLGATAADVQPFPDPWITLAAIAERTQRIRLGSWITPVARRQPWQVARDLATLDRLADGRVILGVGLGRRSDYDRFGTAWDPPTLGRKLDEALEIIDGLWSGEPFSYHGQYYQLEDSRILPTPQQRPRIKIVTAGLWPNKAPIRRGARWDGIIPHYPGDGIASGDELSPEQHVRDLVAYYHGIADEPGEIMLPANPPDASPEYSKLCSELGVTWLLTAKPGGNWTLDTEAIRAGPPSR